MNLKIKLLILSALFTICFKNYSMEQSKDDIEPAQMPKAQLIDLLEKIETEILKIDGSKIKHFSWPSSEIDLLLWGIDSSLIDVKIINKKVQLRLTNDKIDNIYTLKELRIILRKTIKRINEKLSNLNSDFYRVAMVDSFNSTIINNLKLTDLINRNHLIIDGQKSKNILVKKFYNNFQDKEQIEFLINKNTLAVLAVIFGPYILNSNIASLIPNLYCDSPEIFIIKLFILELLIWVAYYSKEALETGKYKEIYE